MKTFERYCGHFCLTIALLLIAGVAQAQTRVTPCNAATPNNALCLDITAPSTNEDGTTTVMPISYRVEQKNGTTWTTIGTYTTQTVYLQNLAPGTYTFRVYAISRGLESRPSAEGSGAATAIPSPPVPPAFRVVQVIIGVDHAPVFIVNADGTRSSTLAGVAEVGTTCGGPQLFSYRGSGWRKPMKWLPYKVSANSRVAAPCARG